MTTTGEFIGRIRTAYGLPASDTLTEADLEVVTILGEIWEIGKTVGMREAGKA